MHGVGAGLVRCGGWAVVALLALLAAGCAAPQVEELDAGLLAVAAEATATEQTAAFLITTTTDAGDSTMGELLGNVATVEGVVDLTTGTMRATSTVTGGMMALMGELAGTDIIQVGDTQYVRMGLFDVMGLSGRWLEVPAVLGGSFSTGLGGGGGITGFVGGMPGGGQGQDPLAILDVLRDEGIAVIGTGTEEVLGEVMTRYEAAFAASLLVGDTFEQLESLTAEEFPGVVALGEPLPNGGGTIGEVLTEVMAEVEVTMHAWVDDQGRARRVTTTMDAGQMMRALVDRMTVIDPDDPEMQELQAAMGMFGELTVTTVMDVLEFGVPVEVAAPDPASIVGMAEFQAAIQSLDPAALTDQLAPLEEALQESGALEELEASLQD